MGKLGESRSKKNVRRPGQLRDEFRVREVMEILQLPEWKVVNWTRSGHVNKSVSATVGASRRKVFSRLDLYQTAIVAKLVGDGFDIRNTRHTDDGGVSSGEGPHFVRQERIHTWIRFLFEGEYDPESGVDQRLEVAQDWLNRESKDRVFVVGGGWGFDPTPHLIDRARGRGKTELRVAIDRQLKKSGSVYCLEIDQLLNGVDGRIL